MSKKTAVPPSIAPLQRVIAQPITDPAERAALDKLRKHKKRKHRPDANTPSGRAAKKRA